MTHPTANSLPTFTLDQLRTALNHAADETLNVFEPDDDESLRDAINLVVNAGIHFVENTDASIQEAIEASYDDFADELLARLS
jgi:hypothetical protein